MQCALQRHEKDLAERRARREDELAFIKIEIDKQNEKDAKEKDAMDQMKKFQMQELDIQVAKRK